MASTKDAKARKPSKVVKPKKTRRKSTVATKNHRFKSFSERIANLKIDPIRRRRNPDDSYELSDKTATYFGKSLEEWKDLNLSSTFTAFAKEVSPLCDSLPVVLHNEEKLMSLLVNYIGKGDGLALEPLLTLMSHFAHDLDTRFEKHFRPAVSTVAAVAAKHPDPAVVEWCFTCIAWLFRYLSRLLTPDLRPLYDLMAQYLGKEAQKPFIVRFAAESMSFLVRKAAAKYNRNEEPLDNFVSHMLEDCRNSIEVASNDLHRQGVMTLLTESIKGVQSGVHSGGLFVLRSVLKHTVHERNGDDEVLMEIVQGTLTSLIHHTDAETFRPIQDTVMEFVRDIEMTSQSSKVRVATQLIFTIATVRKGTRITDWTTLVKSCEALVKLEEQRPGSVELCPPRILSAVAVVFQNAPLDTVLPTLNIFETLRIGAWAQWFLRFCDLYARLGRERFDDLLLPQFRKFVLEQSEDDNDGIFLRLPLLSMQGQEKRLNCSDGLQRDILRQLKAVGDESGGDDLHAIGCAHIVLAALPHVAVSEATWQNLVIQRISLTKQSLMNTDTPCTDINNFALGSCFASTLGDRDASKLDLELWTMLCTQSSRFIHLEKFWVNLSQYLKTGSSPQIPLDGAHMHALEAALVRGLSMPSHIIRQSALEIVQSIYQLRKEHIPHVLSAALAIESTPVSFETSRSISMNIRRLGSAYSELDEFLQRAVPTYCFGLLNLQLSPAWEDVLNVLADMCKTVAGEEVITSTAQSWLEEDVLVSNQSQTESSPHILDCESTGFQVVSDFECSNFARLSAVCQQVFEAPYSGYLSPEQRFLSEHTHIPTVASGARGQALKVLNKMPSIAEKRSRMLVPVLLSWAGNLDSNTSDEPTEACSHRWSRKDQKTMLGIFAQFSNPKVLFKSSEVYSALLNLCANGDVEIQRSALKAVFTWKEPAVNRYEEHLINLLDESRFREELSVFIQDPDEDDETVIRREHYSGLMPILLRLLYGRAVAGGNHEQSSRRKAIFVALSCHDQSVLSMFVEVVLGSASDINILSGGKLDEQSFETFNMPHRRQLGMLNMIDDMLGTLGSQMYPFGVKVLSAILLCSVSACRLLEQSENGGTLQNASLLRSIRQIGIQGLAKIFRTTTTLDLSSYAGIAAQELVIPRLERFASENTQSISGILRLLSAWASSQKTNYYFIDFHKGIPEATSVLLRNTITKDEVRLFILQDILDPVLLTEGEISLSIQDTTSFVQSVGDVLGRAPTKDVLDACVTSFSLLSGHIHDDTQAKEVVRVCSLLLTKPSRIVSYATKTGLLKTILPLVETCDTSLRPLLYDALCGLFSRIPEQDSRVLLSNVLVKVCQSENHLLETAKICQDLNSVGGRLDEPDHSRREAGFAKIYKQYDQFSLEQWQSILHNCLFYIKDSNDMVNRTSASRALERFIDAAASSTEDFKPLISTALITGIAYGVKSSSELVRAEYLRLLGRMVEAFPEWLVVKDMKNLTVDGDEEASFFNNILHIQQHRRLRALRRLADEAVHIGSGNVSRIFIPLLEHFIFDQAEGDTGRTLADQTIQTMGALCRSLHWSAFRATFKRYTGLLGSESHEKYALRLLSGLSDALLSRSGRGSEEHCPVNNTGPSFEIGQPTLPNEDLSTASDHLDEHSEEYSGPPSIQIPRDTTQSPTLKTAHLDIVLREFLSPLTEYLHRKDESTVDRRMPVAISIVKVLLSLPESEMSARLAPVLTDVCHVLRSRSQEARDQTRKTLGDIYGLIGPSYLGFILKELRSALQRGYQLHVLSFTVHHLLVNAVDGSQTGDLDAYLPELTSIIMDDIFGITGQEKDAEEYKSGMREVKSSKSFDTMELLARVTSIKHLGRLIQPLRAFLSQKLDSKMLGKTDNLLARLRKGIDQNPTADNRDTLIFCHEIVRSVHAEQIARPAESKQHPRNANMYLIQPEPYHISRTKNDAPSQAFKLVSFALNLLRKVLHRHEDLITPANLAGFLPIAGDALVQGQEEVQLSALKLLSTIMKVPLAELDVNAAIYVKEAVGLIKTAPSITTASAKAALELITSVLRERRSAQVKDRDIADVLKALKGNLDEPDRQGIIYKFLRAVLGRQILITEVYEIMDEVVQAAVTNPDRNVRESARSAYLQFVLDYPSGEGRWNKSVDLLFKNLEYEHATGRQSVMELIHQLLSKLSDEKFADVSSNPKRFAAVALVQVADQDQSCRNMAALLTTALFERAEEKDISTYLGLMDKWIAHEASHRIVALKCWAAVLRAKKSLSSKRLESLRDKIDNALSDGDTDETTVDKRVAETALQTFEVLLEVAPGIGFAKGSERIWKSLDLFITESETEVIAAKLLGIYFNHLASTNSMNGKNLAALPLKGAGGLELNADELRQKCSSTLQMLLQSDPDDFNETLKGQFVRNLVFLGRCFAANGMKWEREGPNDASALSHLFGRLSYTIRQESTHVSTRTAAIQCQLALVNSVGKVPNLESVMRPLYSLTDSSIAQPSSEMQKDLVDNARELLDLLRKKVGGEDYIASLGNVRAAAMERREDRRIKRRIDVVSNPERVLRKKRR